MVKTLASGLRGKCGIKTSCSQFPQAKGRGDSCRKPSDQAFTVSEWLTGHSERATWSWDDERLRDSLWSTRTWSVLTNLSCQKTTSWATPRLSSKKENLFRRIVSFLLLQRASEIPHICAQTGVSIYCNFYIFPCRCYGMQEILGVHFVNINMFKWNIYAPHSSYLVFYYLFPDHKM